MSASSIKRPTEHGSGSKDGVVSVDLKVSTAISLSLLHSRKVVGQFFSTADLLITQFLQSWKQMVWRREVVQGMISTR